MTTLETQVEVKPWIKGKEFRGHRYVLKIDAENPKIIWFCTEENGVLEPEDRYDYDDTSPCMEWEISQIESDILEASPQAVDFFVEKMFAAQYEAHHINEGIGACDWQSEEIDELFDHILTYLSDPEHNSLEDPHGLGSEHYNKHIISLIPKLTPQERNKLWHIFYGRRGTELAETGQISFPFAEERGNFSFANELGEDLLYKTLDIPTQQDCEWADRKIADAYATVHAELVKQFFPSQLSTHDSQLLKTNLDYS